MQSTIPKLGAGTFVTAMLAVLAALTLDRAVSNLVYEIADLVERYVGQMVGGVLEFMALLMWALVVTVIFVVVAQKQGKKSET
jgi:L-asparagine transporter-like permease